MAKYHIPEQKHEEQLIPLSATIIQDEKSIETDFFQVCFKNYNRKLCGVKDLKGSCGKKALKIIVDITNLNSLEKFKQNHPYKSIKKDNEYTKLFNRLPLDVDLKECTIGQAERFFFFIIEKKMIVVAIMNKHLETKKKRG